MREKKVFAFNINCICFTYSFADLIIYLLVCKKRNLKIEKTKNDDIPCYRLTSTTPFLTMNISLAKTI